MITKEKRELLKKISQMKYSIFGPSVDLKKVAANARRLSRQLAQK